MLNVCANEEQIVGEEQLKEWGYFTQKFNAGYNYRELNDLDDEVEVRYQLIRSKDYIEGSDNTYYYFELSEECYPSIFGAFKRWLTLRGFDEKEYKIGKISSNCVRIIDTSANFATYKEQPRIFVLYNKYLD